MKKPVFNGQQPLAQGDKKTAKKKDGDSDPLIRKVVRPGIPLNDPINVF